LAASPFTKNADAVTAEFVNRTKRVSALLSEICTPLPHHKCANEIGLARKMVVHTGLADADDVSDHAITEAVVAACHDERAGAVEDVVGG